MTLLVSWIGVDARGPSSIYLASDSRISWGDGPTWDYGRKLFASRGYPEILAYFGDVLFPSHVLGQLMDLVDLGVFFGPHDSPGDKWMKVLERIKASREDYPNVSSCDFGIVYGTREKSGMDSVFHVYSIEWQPGCEWTNERRLSIPKESGVIGDWGSGHKPFVESKIRWLAEEGVRTSRGLFGAFCEALQSGEDARSGGAPQLVRIYRKGPAKSLGVAYQDKRYLLGMPIAKSCGLHSVEWRNSLFERVDWETLKPLEDAQRQPRPRGGGNA